MGLWLYDEVLGEIHRYSYSRRPYCGKLTCAPSSDTAKEPQDKKLPCKGPARPGMVKSIRPSAISQVSFWKAGKFSNQRKLTLPGDNAPHKPCEHWYDKEGNWIEPSRLAWSHKVIKCAKYWTQHLPHICWTTGAIQAKLGQSKQMQGTLTGALPAVFWHFLLQKVLPATTACTFSFLICPDVSAPAALASLLFAPRRHKTWEKRSVSRRPYLFARLHLLSSDFLHVWASAELSCTFISPHCRKFSFQTSFDK